ncbi:WSC multi-domain protein [Pyrenophora tritici-repentis]|nr:WSC multi-domain protein [Pyrenophora tritici-repentis]KAI0618583.1 WSC multi-domain protein [Pyrenophora tritici-repentis]KAI1675377.1 WSC domain containing protein [Pyrenophora tritici-repentis]PZC89500.1 WSC domain containing protein [Pyrenophora tritici-repentis]PZD23380.1 WSC domain containing protein [Pyrenophora tritici-repentis]
MGIKQIRGFTMSTWVASKKTAKRPFQTTHRLVIKIRASWIIFASSLCANVYGIDAQQVLSSSLDLAGNSYKCENSAKPSLTCADPSVSNQSCLSTCENGLNFKTSIPDFLQPGGGSSSDSSLDDCQESKEECLKDKENPKNDLNEKKASNKQSEAEQEFSKDKQDLENRRSEKEQELLQQEKNSTAALSECQNKAAVTYLGCYSDARNRVLADKMDTNNQMTIMKCAFACQGYRYFGVQDGKECHCGNSFKYEPELLDDSLCGNACSGNNKQKCGGGWKNSVYEMKV